MDHLEALSTFQRLNRTRIDRLSTLLPIKAHFFLEVLPLLFQTNNAMLPGYTSESLFLLKLVLGIPAQASGKNLT
jgi:adenylate cyclase